MGYKIWTDLIGRTNASQDVLDALQKAGVTSSPLIPRQKLSAFLEIDGMMLEFRHEHFFPDLEEALGEGGGVLTSVTMWLADEAELYHGDLPYNIPREASRASMHKMFGEPDVEEEDELLEEWFKDGIVLRADYAEDFGSLASLSIMMPIPKD